LLTDETMEDITNCLIRPFYIGKIGYVQSLLIENFSINSLNLNIYPLKTHFIDYLSIASIIFNKLILKFIKSLKRLKYPSLSLIVQPFLSEGYMATFDFLQHSMMRQEMCLTLWISCEIMLSDGLLYSMYPFNWYIRSKSWLLNSHQYTVLFGDEIALLGNIYPCFFWISFQYSCDKIRNRKWQCDAKSSWETLQGIINWNETNIRAQLEEIKLERLRNWW
jgi:hypothetical protein